jgi:hypothetical protein
MRLNVMMLTGKILTVEVELSDTIAIVKSKIHTANYDAEHSGTRIRLVFGGMDLQDDRTLEDYSYNVVSAADMMVHEVQNCGMVEPSRPDDEALMMPQMMTRDMPMTLMMTWTSGRSVELDDD